MTLSQIISAPACELEAMSDADVENFFRPFFVVTRPPLEPPKKSGGSSKSSAGGSGLNMLLELANAAAAAKKSGIDISATINLLKSNIKK